MVQVVLQVTRSPASACPRCGGLRVTCPSRPSSEHHATERGGFMSGSTAVGPDPRAGPTSLPLDSLASVGAALASRPYVRRGVAVSAERIPVLLVDDHAILRDGLKAL